MAKKITPLTNFDIIYHLRDVPNFTNVWMRDQIPKTIPRNSCGVINLDISSNSGTHWCGWYKDKFFDSYGFSAPDAFLKAVQYDEIKYNDFPIQKISDPPFCGHLCIAFIKAMQRGEDYQKFLLSIYRV